MKPTQITGREPRLSSQLSSGKYRLSLRRFATLLNILPPEAVDLNAIIVALESDEFLVRFNAAKLLARRGDRPARQIVAQALDHPSPLTRASVARQLYGFSWFAVEPMVAKALFDEDWRVREAAIYALCDMYSLHAYLAMETHLKQENEIAVFDAMTYGLRNRQDPATVPVLELALHIADRDIQVKALEALGANESWEASKVIYHTLKNDNDPIVVYNATLSLFELLLNKTLGKIIPVLITRTGDMRGYILRGIFHATNYLKINLPLLPEFDEFIDLLEHCLLTGTSFERKQAIWLAVWIRTQRTVQLTMNAYASEQDETIKAHILRVAVGLMANGSDVMLRDALKHPSSIVRETAKQMTDERERTGVILEFDQFAHRGKRMEHPHLYQRDGYYDESMN